MAVVVTCPSCRAPARVPDEGLGRGVACPACRRTFVATFAAGPPAPVLPHATPVRPPVPLPVATVVAPPPSQPADPHPDPPHDSPPGPPVSVLVGLALLPFVIPLVWLAGPALVGREAALSVATPLALAVAASVLSLAVVFTVDWTGATRVKGVLMLVGMAYLAGGMLYFLKKDMVDWGKRVLGVDFEWREFAPKDGACSVRMPGQPVRDKEQPLPGWLLVGHRATDKTILGPHSYTLGYGRAEIPPGENPGAGAVGGAAVAGAFGPGGPAWFDQVRRAAEGHAGGAAAGDRAVTQQDTYPGREWVIPRAGGGFVRVVRVFVVPRPGGPRVYYLAAEGPNLTPDDPDAKRLFDSFHIKPTR